MPHVAWTLTDLSAGTPIVLQFEINPNQFEPPGRRMNITTMQTTTGASMIFGGGDNVPEGQMRGAVNSAAFYAQLKTWFAKWYPITLTDDLGNSWDILIQDVSWTRLNRYLYPNRYDYTVRFLAVS